MRPHVFAIICSVLTLFMAKEIHAQAVPIIGGPSKEVLEQMEKAQQLEQQGKDGEARTIYETLYKTVKNDNVFWHYLLVAERMEDYDTMERLVKEWLQKTPDDPSMIRYLSRVAYGRGDKKKARSILLDMMDGHWSDVGRAYIVTNELNRQGDLDAMVEIYNRVRRETRNDSLFAAQLAGIYGATTRYVPAIEEYLKQLEESKPIAAQIESTIKRARDAGVENADLARPLKKYLESYPANTDAAGILANLLYASGDAAGAYKTVAAAASAAKNPKPLLDFAQKLKADGHIDNALAAFEEYYTAFPGEPDRVAAMLDAATIRAIRGDSTGALGIYRRLAADYRGTREGDIAELKIIAFSEAAGDFEAFAKRLADFAAATKFRDVSREALMVLGKAHLMKGNAAAAEESFKQAALASRTPTEKYETSVMSARLKFFTGDITAMGTEIDAAIQNKPSGEEANELLTLKVLGMQSGNETGGGFASYAKGRFAIYRGDSNDAVTNLTAATADTSSAAAAYAAMDLAALKLKTDGLEASIEWYLKAASIAREKTVAAKALLTVADILSQSPGGKDRAGEIYRQILTDMPGSVYESEIRRKLLSQVTR